jgi:aminoglycoside phosphotransferase (APT) family kinase protein
MAEEPEMLSGGIANAGAVVRVGGHVLRPSNQHTATIHDFLRYLRGRGFTGAPNPVGVDPDGRERLEFIDGEVPLPPYPAWAQSDESLASIARLLRRYHEAAAGYRAPAAATWSREMADTEPTGDVVVCHNDVCLENVVFHDGIAVALIDFDFAAPGRRAYDLSQFARMCVPIDDESRVRFGWRPADLEERLRLVADAYGLSPDRDELFAALTSGIERGGEFVRRRVEAGDANFTAMWESMGGMARFDRRRAWFTVHAARFRDALG